MIKMYTKIKDAITINDKDTSLNEVNGETAKRLSVNLKKYNKYFRDRLNSYGTIDVGVVQLGIEDNMLVTSCCPRFNTTAKEVAECMTQVLKEAQTRKIIHEESSWTGFNDNIEVVAHKVLVNPQVASYKVCIA